MIQTIERNKDSIGAFLRTYGGYFGAFCSRVIWFIKVFLLTYVALSLVGFLMLPTSKFVNLGDIPLDLAQAYALEIARFAFIGASLILAFLIMAENGFRNNK